MRTMNRLWRLLRCSVIVAAIVELCAPQVAGAACGWQITELPGGDAPESVVAFAANDVWMLAKSEGSNALYRWDGNQWSEPALPAPPPRAVVSYYSISGVSDRDLWLVGQAVSGGIYFPISEHFDGASWTRIAVPYDKQTSCFQNDISGALLAVRSFATNASWALEARCQLGQQSFMAVRWDGSQWKNVSAFGSQGFELGGNGTTDSFMSGSSDHDLWVVGADTLHFDGHSWTSYGPKDLHGILRAVYASSTTDAWAVGVRVKGFPTMYKTYTWHWNGSSWSEIQSPNRDGMNVLDSVSGSASNDVWAVGASGPREDQGMALHWDGIKWSFASPKHIFPNETLLVHAFAPNVLWAFGYGPYAASYCR